MIKPHVSTGTLGFMQDDWELWEEENCWAAESEWRRREMEAGMREFMDESAELYRQLRKRLPKKGEE